MNLFQLIGFVGIFFLLASGFLPLAYLNDGLITIFPLFNNFDLENSFWVWKDISAFAATYAITLFVCVYLLIKGLKIGYLIAASLNFIVLLFIYFSTWLTSVKVENLNNVVFSYSSISGTLIVIGYMLFFYSGFKIEKKL